MDAKELLKKELREALMDPKLYKKFRVTRDHPVRTSCSQSSHGIMQGNSGDKKTIKCIGTKTDEAEDTDEQDFAMQQKHSSRATVTTAIPAIDGEIGPLLLNEEFISNNTKILKPKPTAPLTRKIQIVPIESVHKSCKNPNFVFRPISPAGQSQEAQGASPEGGLLTFKDLMDQNEHKAYERENRVTAGNCNIYKKILAAAKENRKSSFKMSTRGDVEYPCNIDKNNVHHSLQKSNPNYTEEKLRKVWMHIANSNLDETPLDTQMEDIEQQSKTIGILSSLSTEGKFDADQFASVSKEASVHDQVQPSAVLSEQSNTVSDAIPYIHGDDVTTGKELLSSISAEDKIDADQFASVSREASALDLVQPSAVLSEHSNTVSDPILNNHGDGVKEDKELLSSISAEDKIDADRCAIVSKEASALDLVQPSAVLSECSNTVSDPIPNNHGDDITEDTEILSNISTEDKIDADKFAGVSKEASALNLAQPSAVISECSNTVSDPIPNNHGDDITEDTEILSNISTEDKLDADQFASVSKEASALDLVQPSAVLSECSNTASDPISNNHGDNITEAKELLSSTSTEDKIDADQFASVSKEATALNLGQPSAVLSESSNTIYDGIPNNHGDDITEDTEILSNISTEDKIDADQFASVSKEATALDLVQPSAVLSESTVSDTILSNHGDDNTTPEKELPCDSSHATATTYNADRSLDVPMESSAHKLYQSSTILSKVIPNNHGDSTKQDQEIPSCLNTVDTCDAVRYVDVPTQASPNNMDQSQTVVRESAEAIHDDIHNNHSHNTKQDQDIPSVHPSLAKHGAAYAHDLDRPSAGGGETSVIFDDTPNMYSNACPDNEAMESNQAKPVQFESIADEEGSSGSNQSSGLINNPSKLRSEDGDANVSSNISEDSRSGEDDMLKEVYQSCLAKGMRPKYLSSNYLKGLANARKTAAEIRARKPEPRVKLDKPCRLDTNLMYAVRQSLKRSLPLIAGKNKLSALMMMADGMFDEMSLDRDLDDLAWPFDPLAELRESGLWMVDYMDPHPTGSTKSRMKNQSAATLREPNKTISNDIQFSHWDTTYQEQEIPSDNSQGTLTNYDSKTCVDVSSESSAHKLNQCTGMLSESNNAIFEDNQINHCDATYQEQEIPSDNSQETLSTDDSERRVDVSSESSAHKLDQCTGMLSESNKTVFDNIPNNHGDATYQEQEMPSDNSQETLSTDDSERCVDVSSESSAHKLDQCMGMLSESNNTIFEDNQINHCDATYQEQEIPSDNSQETLSTDDSERCVDVSSESSAHKLDQCTGMLSESNKTVFDNIPNNHGDATYQEQEMPSDNSQETLSTDDSERCVDVSSESSAHKLDQCMGMLSESNNTIFEDNQINHCDATYQEQEIPSDNSQETLSTDDSERCVDVSSESSAHKLDQCTGMLNESNKAIFVNIKNIGSDQISQEKDIPSDNSQETPTDYDSERCVDVSTKSCTHKLDQRMGKLSEANKTIFEDIQKNQDDNTSDVQELYSNNFQGTTTNYDSERCVDDQAKAFTHGRDHSPVVVSERDIIVFNTVRDIRQDNLEMVSGLGTILEVSEEGCTGVPKEVSVHKQNHVPADFGEKGTSASSYFDVTPENQEISPGQPIVANNDEDNSAYVKEAASASEMSQSSDNVNNPVMQRSKKNRSVSPSIFENDIDDDDKDMLNEVYQSCLAKGMRPKFLSKNYLKSLANARKTAAEIKARKPEPRVKLDKPCHLDTNLTYAVRQSLKRSLPLIAGKNKLSALMMMADGMFDEMSLDRDLDDLAWPFDPLAELRESGLAMVDYMEPHPTGSTNMNTSHMKGQSSPSDAVVPSASTQDENDHNSSDSVVKVLDNVVPTNEQRSITDEDISSTEFHKKVSSPTGQPVATTATDDLSSPQSNSPETSLGTSVVREDLLEELAENDSDTDCNVEMHESSQVDNLMNNVDTLTWALKCNPEDLGQISPIDFQPPISHSSDILQTTSVDSDLQSEDSALGQDSYSTSFDDTCSTSDFSSDIEEVDPSSQNLKQKIQFFSNATSTLFSKPPGVSHVNFKVSVPSKVHHFEKIAQEERLCNPQKFLAKDNQLVSHNRLSSAGDAKIKIEKFERMPTVPTVNIKYETLDSAIKEDTSASKVNVKNRVKMFEVSDGLTAFNTQPISAAKPKITGRLNKSKIAFFENLANSNI